MSTCAVQSRGAPVTPLMQSRNPPDAAAADLVIMGRILGAFGIRGWVKVATFTEQIDTLCDYPQWWLRGGVLTGGAKAAEEWRSVEVTESKAHGGHVVALLATCADRTAAEMMRGAQIAVRRDSLPALADGEYYQSDLIGLEVLNTRGERLGKLVEIFGAGAHEVMRVVAAEDGSGKPHERLIPFVPQIARAVDVEAGEIRVDWELEW